MLLRKHCSAADPQQSAAALSPGANMILEPFLQSNSPQLTRKNCQRNFKRNNIFTYMCIMYVP